MSALPIFCCFVLAMSMYLFSHWSNLANVYHYPSISRIGHNRCRHSFAFSIRQLPLFSSFSLSAAITSCECCRQIQTNDAVYKTMSYLLASWYLRTGLSAVRATSPNWSRMHFESGCRMGIFENIHLNVLTT